MDNCNKIKNTCTDSTFATCVDYENNLGENTKITVDCVTLDDTTKDIYDLVDDLFELIDLSNLGESCMPYIGIVTIKSVLQRYEQEICDLKDRVEELETTAICDMPIAGCDFQLGPLVDLCNEVPVTFGQLLQVMITQINNNVD
jgi:hypothetical protein